MACIGPFASQMTFQVVFLTRKGMSNSEGILVLTCFNGLEITDAISSSYAWLTVALVV